MTAQAVLLEIAMVLLALIVLAIVIRCDERQERRNKQEQYLTLGDLCEIQDCAKDFHRYVDRLIELGWSMVQLSEAQASGFRIKRDVQLCVHGAARDYTHNIRYDGEGEKTDAMLNVLQREVEETSSLLLPVFRNLYGWCRKNEVKTIQTGEGEEVWLLDETGK